MYWIILPTLSCRTEPPQATKQDRIQWPCGDNDYQQASPNSSPVLSRDGWGGAQQVVKETLKPVNVSL